jgi:hypothetical protein
MSGSFAVPGSHDADSGPTRSNPRFELRGGVVDEQTTGEDGLVDEVNDIAPVGIGVTFEPSGAVVGPGGAGCIGRGDEDDATEVPQGVDASKSVWIGGQGLREARFAEDIVTDGPEVTKGLSKVELADMFGEEPGSGPLMDLFEQGGDEVSDDAVDVETDEVGSVRLHGEGRRAVAIAVRRTIGQFVKG